MADVEDRLERALCLERQPYPHFAGRALAVKVATRINAGMGVGQALATVGARSFFESKVGLLWELRLA